MSFFAMLKDSFRETVDGKTFWVLLVVSALLVFLCASLSFTELTPDEAIKDIARGFSSIAHRDRGDYLYAEYPVKFTVEEVRTADNGGYAFRLRASPAKEFHRLVRHWNAMQEGLLKKQGDPIPDADAATDFELQRRCLVARLREQQLVRVGVEAEEGGGDDFLYRVKIRPARPELLRGAHRMNLLFGLADFRLPLSAAMIVAIIQMTLADWVAGWVGIIIAIIVTASFVPDMLQKGRVDLLLAKPLARPTILFYKYLGGLIYILLNAACLIGGCWLALAARSGHWDASFLWSIPILVFHFAILHAFSTWMGVLTHSPLASILATMGLWLVSFGAGAARLILHGPGAPATPPPGWAMKGIDFAYYVLPKTIDLKAVSGRLIARGSLGEEAFATLPQTGLAEIDWAVLLLSSGAFIAACLSLACLSFSRRDY